MEQCPHGHRRGEQSLTDAGGESRGSDGTLFSHKRSHKYSVGVVVVVLLHIMVEIDDFPNILSMAVPTSCATIKGKYTSMATAVHFIPYKRKAACVPH